MVNMECGPIGRGWVVGLTVLAALLIAGPAAAQGPRGLTFVGGIGYEQGGPGASLLDGLTAAGMDDTKMAWGSGTTRYPLHYTEGLNVVAFIGGRFRFDAPLSLELLLSNGQRGHAEGYSATDQETLVVAYASFLASVTGSVHLGPVRVGAGPVINAMAWDATRNSQDAGSATTSLVGGQVEGGFSVRAGDTRVSLRGGVRRFPPVDLGPAIAVPMEAEYRSFFVGVTVSPAIR